MTTPSQQPSPTPAPARSADVVLHEERLSVQLARTAVERVVLRRRIVTEVVQVDVTVRREVLDVQTVPATGQEAARSGPLPGPLVIVLSEEVPVVSLGTRPYEQVVVHVDTLDGQQEVSAALSREQVELSQTSPAG